MSAESSCLFKKGNWNVNTKDEMSNVLVVAVPQDVADMIDKFKRLLKGISITFKVQEMKNCGFDPKEYSCIYNLVKNEGSKMSKVFSENEMGDTILFDGTCSETYSMRANRETKQFRATISRLKRQSNETSEMHFLTEKERRQLAFNQNMERQQRMRERDKYLSRESEKRQYERKVVNDTKSSAEIRTSVIDLLHKHEYLKLEELMRLCPGTPRNKLESELKKVAEIERMCVCVCCYA
ncbi:hypothetical protein WA556_000740 [Blastocystis sp. ATCC 50177/Nand II]